MIIQKEFLNKLKDFGLNSYESKLWTALLSRGISTAGELSDIANVPRSRSYDVLESLEKKGFIVMKLGKPIKYIAVPPEDVLERVKKKITEDADKQSQIIDSLKESEILSELNVLHTQGIEMVEPTDLSGSFKGRANLYNHLELMIKGAESSITIVTTSMGLIRKVDVLKKVLERVKQRGVKIRIAAPITKENMKAAKDISQIAEVRDVSCISARFVIVDNKEIAIMLVNDTEVHPSYDVGIWINTQFFADALQIIFDRVWNEAKEPKQLVRA